MAPVAPLALADHQVLGDHQVMMGHQAPGVPMVQVAPLVLPVLLALGDLQVRGDRQAPWVPPARRELKAQAGLTEPLALKDLQVMMAPLDQLAPRDLLGPREARGYLVPRVMPDLRGPTD